MKIIHCADVHLDSKMTANLPADKARERRNELLSTFLRMTDYAEEQNVSAILISGDLFDTKTVSARAKNAVAGAILAHPGITFFYLRGNHDRDGFLEFFDTIPENLKFFSDTWTSYILTDQRGEAVKVIGLELTDKNADIAAETLRLDSKVCNIVMLHGQTVQYRSKERAETIDVSQYQNRGIDYLALGHVHEYREGALSDTAKWCYPGCLLGRGFDETGEHGFVLLSVDAGTHRVSPRFIPFAKRSLHEIRIDVTGCEDALQIENRVYEAVSQIAPSDLIKVVLTGRLDVSCEKNLYGLGQMLSEMFYFAKISDETRLTVNYADFAYDASLKGEYVRLIEGDPALSDEEKAELIRCGIQALLGEEIEL